MEARALACEDITENVIAIRINHSYRENMTQAALYDVTRGYWILNKERAEQAEYAFCVYKGEVKEVYRIKQWLPAGSTPRPTLPKRATPEGRYEFVGEIAEKTVRDKYIGKSIANLYKRGAANPIRYFLTSERRV